MKCINQAQVTDREKDFFFLYVINCWNHIINFNMKNLTVKKKVCSAELSVEVIEFCNKGRADIETSGEAGYLCEGNCSVSEIF